VVLVYVEMLSVAHEIMTDNLENKLRAGLNVTTELRDC